MASENNDFVPIVPTLSEEYGILVMAGEDILDHAHENPPHSKVVKLTYMVMVLLFVLILIHSGIYCTCV